MLDWGKGNLTYQPETISDHFINKICGADGRKDVEAMMWKIKNYQRKLLEKSCKICCNILKQMKSFKKHKRTHEYNAGIILYHLKC